MEKGNWTTDDLSQVAKTMKRSTPIVLLAPHALACVLFVTASIWMEFIQTNRSAPDLYLAIAGFVALAAAVLASLFFLGLVIVRPEARRGWPWLMVHLGALVLVAAMASEWFGTHLA